MVVVYPHICQRGTLYQEILDTLGQQRTLVYPRTCQCGTPDREIVDTLGHQYILVQRLKTDSSRAKGPLQQLVGLTLGDYS